MIWLVFCFGILLKLQTCQIPWSPKWVVIFPEYRLRKMLKIWSFMLNLANFCFCWGRVFYCLSLFLVISTFGFFFRMAAVCMTTCMIWQKKFINNYYNFIKYCVSDMKLTGHLPTIITVARPARSSSRNSRAYVIACHKSRPLCKLEHFCCNNLLFIKQYFRPSHLQHIIAGLMINNR